jgi:histone H3/H4
MKKVLPDDAKVSMDAKICIEKCAVEFIRFVTSEGGRFPVSSSSLTNRAIAAEYVIHRGQTLLTGHDIIVALETLDLGPYAKILRTYKEREYRASSLSVVKPSLDDPDLPSGEISIHVITF